MKNMKVTEVKLYHLHLPMRFVFKTAKAKIPMRETLIVQVINEKGQSGWGECVSFTTPFYTDETLGMSKKRLSENYLPLILGKYLTHPFDIHKMISNRLPMAVAGLENALLDLYAKERGENIIRMVFEENPTDFAELGIVLGNMKYCDLREKIKEYQSIGCHRFKIKIKAGDGGEQLRKICAEFPRVSFLVDANRGFCLSQINEVKEYDSLGLICIEEPFTFNHLEECKNMQDLLKTPICLDESVQTIEDLQTAYQLNILRMLNVKIGKFGGIYYTKSIINFCREKGVGFWIGSMVETGISKILHIQMAGLNGVVIPGDLSDSIRYFKQDIIEPDIAFDKGKMKIPDGPGIGVEIRKDVLEKYTVDLWKRGIYESS